ncbi:MAG: hypothetical protein ACYCTI_07295 [Acidimicrobiales bacterium]
MRFPRTRLTDTVHREAYLSSAELKERQDFLADDTGSDYENYDAVAADRAAAVSAASA